MKKIMHLIFLRNPAMLAAVSVLLLAGMVSYLVWSTVTLTGHLNAALKTKADAAEEITFFDLQTFEKVRGRLR